MTAIKKVSMIGSWIIIIAIGGHGLYTWFTAGVVNAMTLVYFSLGLGFLFHTLTWGNMKGKHEHEKDELEQHISLKSSKYSYYILLVVMILILVISEKATAMQDLKNIPLVIAICLAWVTMPFTEWLVSKKYR
ncbi:hypothetical protein A374_15833 [Fictibacillus macauensis ZFHKF-1]|uniref:Uncharacterized protein n=1 Tax=Fictibacillus macauensis ZFHKF-1 TaxID=1196324 RepID=I8IXQ7_9BACL|nr:hypothetical protein [Fictibacillus macauensis]EIT84271.1 hypothetical protein A374_15833 [Fictibacillus macauensis ZFHKF-1]